jgi:hypothetical protein
MKTVKTVLAAALAASCAIAQSDNAAVTRAATDPSTIHNAVAELSGVTIQAFAAEVIDAIAAKPQAPVSKVLDLVDASSNFLAESDESNLADVIVAMISNVPFEALPEWTSMMFDAVQDATRDIEDAPYNKLVADVVSKIGDLADYTDEDKVVVTTFAIKLLSRGVEDPTHEPLLSALAVVPPTYRGQVEGSLPSVFAGDYSSLLAGVEIIEVPAEEKGGKTEGGAAGGEGAGVAGGEEGAPAGGEEGGFEQTDGGETTTVVAPEGEPTPAPQEKPPVPKPYKGQ